jgi:hypothetical protein
MLNINNHGLFFLNQVKIEKMLQDIISSKPVKQEENIVLKIKDSEPVTASDVLINVLNTNSSESDSSEESQEEEESDFINTTNTNTTTPESENSNKKLPPNTIIDANDVLFNTVKNIPVDYENNKLPPGVVMYSSGKTGSTNDF